MSVPPKNYVTPEEYLAIDRASDVQHEYINGEILDMTGGSKHQEYLLVSQVEPFVEHYVRLPYNTWQYLTHTDMESTIRFPSIGQELSMQALYRKVIPA